MIALVPGSSEVVDVLGTAALSVDPEQMQAFEIQDKAPILATCIKPRATAARPSRALAVAGLCPTPAPLADIDGTGIFKAHVKLSNEREFDAAITRAAISVPGVMKRGLASDYENNMY